MDKKGSSPHETALITGASSGIGLELAKRFARDGFSLVLTARSIDKLNQLASRLKAQYGVAVRVIMKDLAKPEAPEEIFQELNRAGISVDILVNNAGFGSYGFFQKLDLARELKIIQVNITALTHLTKLFLPGMIEKRRGKILNVASTAAFQPGPLMAVYYATKAFVLSFSEAIANELKGTGVTVTCLCPGPTRSGFQEMAAIENVKIVKAGMMSSEEVAEIGYRALLQGKAVAVAGLRNKILTFLVRFGPRSWVTSMVRFIQEEAHSMTGSSSV